jgi:hypothetical protein
MVNEGDRCSVCMNHGVVFIGSFSEGWYFSLCPNGCEKSEEVLRQGMDRVALCSYCDKEALSQKVVAAA